MKVVHRIDANGLYIEDVILEENDPMPADCVDVPFPQGMFLPAKFLNGSWSTTLTQDQITAALKSTPTAFDNLKKQHTDLIFTLMNKGVI